MKTNNSFKRDKKFLKGTLKDFTIYGTISLSILILGGISAYLAFRKTEDYLDKLNSNLIYKDNNFKTKIFDLSNIVKKLDEINQRAFEKALEKVYPEIKHLNDKYQRILNQRLNNFFKNEELKCPRIYNPKGVEKFLDWFYSFGSDYEILLNGKTLIKEKLNEWVVNSGAPIECQIKLKQSFIERKKKVLQIVQETANEYKTELKKILKKAKDEYKTNLDKKLRKLNLPPQVFKSIETIAFNKIDTYFDKILMGVSYETVKTINSEITIPINKYNSARVTVKAFSSTLMTYFVAKKIANRVEEETEEKVIVKIGEKLAAKTAEKVVAGESTFATVTAITSPVLGPAAPLAGLVAAIGSYVLTDYALNKLDEAISRDKFRNLLISVLQKEQKAYEITIENIENVQNEMLRKLAEGTFKNFIFKTHKQLLRELKNVKIYKFFN
jgi:hypothetical protein